MPVLYYSRAADNTILLVLSTIASKQSNGTKRTMAKMIQLLDYLTTHPAAKVRFNASSIIVNIHSDALYLSAPRARSRLTGSCFFGDVPKKGEHIHMNEFVFVLCGILRIVVWSVAGAALGTLFLNIKKRKSTTLALIKLGHHQLPTPVHCDNTTAAGIVNDTVKKNNHSR